MRTYSISTPSHGKHWLLIGRDGTFSQEVNKRWDTQFRLDEDKRVDMLLRQQEEEQKTTTFTNTLAKAFRASISSGPNAAITEKLNAEYRDLRNQEEEQEKKTMSETDHAAVIGHHASELSYKYNIVKKVLESRDKEIQDLTKLVCEAERRAVAAERNLEEAKELLNSDQSSLRWYSEFRKEREAYCRTNEALNKANKEVLTASAAARGYEKTISELQTKLRETQTSLDTSRSVSDDLMKANESLSIDSRQKEMDRDSARAIAASLKEELEKVKIERHHWFNKHTREIEDLKSLAKNLETSLKRSATDYLTLSAEMCRAQAELVAAKKSEDDYAASNKFLTSHISSLQKEIEKANDRFDAIKRVVNP